MAINGADVLVLVNTGTELVPVWTVVGSQTNVKFGEKNATIDTSNKQSGRFSEFLVGRYDATVDLDSLYIPSDAAYASLKDATRNGALIRIRRQESGAALEEASALVTTLNGEFADQAAGKLSATLQVSGAWTAV
jgi:predicted secreted protein